MYAIRNMKFILWSRMCKLLLFLHITTKLFNFRNIILIMLITKSTIGHCHPQSVF
jgi:hypothetical protein